MLPHSERLRSYHQPNGKRHPYRLHLSVSPAEVKQPSCVKSAHNYIGTTLRCTFMRPMNGFGKGLYSLFRFACISIHGRRPYHVCVQSHAIQVFGGIPRMFHIVWYIRKLFDANLVCVCVLNRAHNNRSRTSIAHFVGALAEICAQRHSPHNSREYAQTRAGKHSKCNRCTQCPALTHTYTGEEKRGKKDGEKTNDGMGTKKMCKTTIKWVERDAPWLDSDETVHEKWSCTAHSTFTRTKLCN